MKKFEMLIMEKCVNPPKKFIMKGIELIVF